MATRTVVLSKSQVALIQLAKDVRDQLTQAADNGFQQRVAVIGDELGAPPNIRIGIVNGEKPGDICAQWDDGSTESSVAVQNGPALSLVTGEPVANVETTAP